MKLVKIFKLENFNFFMSEEVFLKIEKLLKENNVEFRVMEHEPTRTSEDAAKVREKFIDLSREEILKSGAKAMIVKSKDKYYQLVISAARKIDFKKVKKIIGNVRFATEEEVEKITDCIPGSVPPFGNLFGLAVYVDPYLLEQENIDFNAGELTKSIFMNTSDWVKLVKPTVKEFGLSF